MASRITGDQAVSRLLVQDQDRRQDVEIKHQRVAELLQTVQADALLLKDPGNIAWMTSGADVHRYTTERCATSVFVTSDARLVATNSVDSVQIFERELFGLGFQLKQREWFQPHEVLTKDLCRGRRVISDLPQEGAQHAPLQIDALRLPLTDLEVERLRQLSQVVVHAVEATCHQLKQGVTEAELAGQVSHRLLKRTVTPGRIQVCADGRNERYRHWTFGEDPVERSVVISCVGRRWGLHAAATRTTCLSTVPAELHEAYQKGLLVYATGIFFARHQHKLGDVWKKVQRIYEKFDMRGEWQMSDQGSVLAYAPHEAQFVPESEYQIQAPSPVFWHPSVGPAMLGDTLLCQENANEQLTHSSSWPQVTVRVKGAEVICPGILMAPTGNSTPTEMAAESEPYQFREDATDSDEPGRVDSIWEIEIPSASTL